MVKAYGVCIKECDLIDTDDENNVKKLKIGGLVQILVQFKENVCSLQMLNDSGIKVDKSIYTCKHSNLAIISNDLVPYLVGSDYWGKLDILRFKKKIEKFREGSKGNLQVIYDNYRYFIEYVITYIGPVSTLGCGFYVGINIMIPDNAKKEALRSRLYHLYNNQNDQTKSFLTVRVEVLFSEIELDSSSEHFKAHESTPTQSLPLAIEHEHGSISTSNAFGDNLNSEQQTEIPEAMEVDLPQVSSQPHHAMEERAKINNEILKTIAIDKLGSKNSKTCVVCGLDSKDDLFRFSCNHKFCCICILDRLDEVKKEYISCPYCGKTLSEKSKWEALNDFISTSLSKASTEKNDKKQSNYFGKNGKKEFDVSEKVKSVETRASSGNKFEIRHCKSCKVNNKYSATKCSQCHRPLSANDYSSVS